MASTENKSRQVLLLFHEKELYQIAAQSFKKRLDQRPHREKLMHDGAEALISDGDTSGNIPACLYLINLDPAYIHNLLVSEDEVLRPAYIISVSRGPKAGAVEREGILIPNHCIRSVGRPELSKRFLLCEDHFFNPRLVDQMKTKVASEALYSDRNALFSTQLLSISESELNWLFEKDHVVSYDRIAADVLRVSKVLNLPVACVHFVGDNLYTKQALKEFCDAVELDPQSLR